MPEAATPCMQARLDNLELLTYHVLCTYQARLVDLELPPEQPIDLLTVAFGATPDDAPDRPAMHMPC